MCTVSLLAVGDAAGFRLAANRDELLSRAPARLPELRRCGDQLALMPIDPVSEGTWIAASDAGLGLTLLNASRRLSGPLKEPVSRGSIIPALLRHASLDAVAAAGLALDPRCYEPFRLVVVDGERAVELRSDGSSIRRSRESRRASWPVLYTSSGLGDEVVEGPRRALFEGWFDAAGDAPAQQDAYHRHSWPARPELSVCLRRSDAATLSYTVIEREADRISLAYLPHAPDEPGSALGSALELRGVTAS